MVSTQPSSVDDISTAFRHDPVLQRRVLTLAAKSNSNNSLISDIAQYILKIGGSSVTNGEQDAQANAKKRKLDDNSASAHSENAPKRVVKAQFELKDVSVSIPQRKKLHLELSDERIQLRNPASGQVEVSEDIKKYAYALRLPVPEKTQKQYNYCLIPQYGEGLGRVNPDSHTFTENILWTTNAGPPKTAQALDPKWSERLSASGDRVVEDALNIALSAANIKLVEPDKKEFASAISEAHRKSETAYHVKAFRGSKEGYLFFLPTGIFFGYKKPLLFFPFDLIHSTAYTSVLQRTFNLVIAVSLPSTTTSSGEEAGETIEEYEFSMLDQADFAGIEAYIKRHELSDASMAATRKAKRLNINKPARKVENGAPAGPGEGDGGEAREESELQKAQQQLEEQEVDEEDEEEEDYDPGSEGESDGSGESSEDEVMGDAGRGRDLVGEELGSEAEDVEDDEEEQEDEDEQDNVVHAVSGLNGQQIATGRKRGDAALPDSEDDDQL